MWSLFIDHRLVALIQTRIKGSLLALKDFIEAGKPTPIITATYPLSEALGAIASSSMSNTDRDEGRRRLLCLRASKRHDGQR